MGNCCSTLQRTCTSSRHGVGLPAPHVHTGFAFCNQKTRIIKRELITAPRQNTDGKERKKIKINKITLVKAIPCSRNSYHIFQLLS